MQRTRLSHGINDRAGDPSCLTLLPGLGHFRVGHFGVDFPTHGHLCSVHRHSLHGRTGVGHCRRTGVPVCAFFCARAFQYVPSSAVLSCHLFAMTTGGVSV